MIQTNGVVILLVGILIGALGVFGYNSMTDKNHESSRMESIARDTGTSHRMPNGEMMMDDGSAMKMNMGDMTMNAMVEDLQGKTGTALEQAFIAGMIPHHQGAVDMARILLRDKTIRPEFMKFAEDIIKAQTAEIVMMKGWVK